MRACDISCAITVATAANTTPNAATDAPYSNAEAVGKSCPTTERVTPSPISSAAATATTSAAAVPACRPTSADESSSVRPTSSSPRVCRTTVNVAIRATPISTVRLVS